MTAKPTPGPWARHPAGGQIVAVNGYVSICNTFENTTHPDPATGWRAEHEANAHLIAAAPELLAALRHLGRCFGEGLRSGLFTQEDVDNSRAAIAKAEGR